MDPQFSEHRVHFEQLIHCALEAADPQRILINSIAHKPDALYVRDKRIELIPGGKIVLISVGKAAAPMARATVQILKTKPDNVIVVRPDHDQSLLPAGWQVFQAGHPLPTAVSLAAGEAVQTIVQNLDERDLLVVLLSGGGSALLELPKPGIGLKDLLQVNEDLLRSGARIEQINVVRKSISMIKGGGLARLAAPARVLTFILSDVVSDDLSVIASGPTTPEMPYHAEAQLILMEHQLWERYPARLQMAMLSRRKDPGLLHEPINILLANNQTVTRATAREAERLGFEVELQSAPLIGEAHKAGAAFAQRLRDKAAEMPLRSYCLIQGGETTVVVHGKGKGGRNQEFALAAALKLTFEDPIALLSLATDGVDGPTDAAGAIVSAQTIKKARTIGLDPGPHLTQNNAYPFLDRLGALVRTGPTQTNLNDIAIGLGYAHR